MNTYIKNILTLFLSMQTLQTTSKNIINMPTKKTSLTKNIVKAWQQFLQHNDWQCLIFNHTPLISGCGLVYELPNFLNRPQEDFAIVDMRSITVAEPHYHPNEDIEIYFVLQGTALVVIGGIEHHVLPGGVIIIPPKTAHFTIPDHEYVIAVVNTPPFSPERYIKLTESHEAVGFCNKQFQKLLCKIYKK